MANIQGHSANSCLSLQSQLQLHCLFLLPFLPWLLFAFAPISHFTQFTLTFVSRRCSSADKLALRIGLYIEQRAKAKPNGTAKKRLCCSIWLSCECQCQCVILRLSARKTRRRRLVARSLGFGDATSTRAAACCLARSHACWRATPGAWPRYA